ncbi:hypothetical protein DL768_001532 [Monosporascus sp. mg162]|nr:hypothetical protein DL768_001532 [Monosporascus sp. mg162]
MEELVAGFRALLSQAGRRLADKDPSFKLGLIIDGLDEFEATDHMPLIQLLREANKYPDVKICASSRPWNAFRDEFQQNPMLRLESLTRQDIQAYVHGQFRSSWGFKEIRVLQPIAAEKLLNDILGKAQGVFLWISVVVRDLLISLQEGDRLSDLQETLNSLPDDLSALFQVMWRRTNSRYRGEAAQYFSILEAYYKHDLLPYTIGIWLGDDEVPLDLSLRETLRISVENYLFPTYRRQLFWDHLRKLLGVANEVTSTPSNSAMLVRIMDTLDAEITKLSHVVDRYGKSLLLEDVQVSETLSPSDTGFKRIPHWCNAAPTNESRLPEDQAQGWYQVDFIGLMAQIPVSQYLKTKIPRDPSIIRTGRPTVPILVNAVVGGLRSDPLDCGLGSSQCDASTRLDLVRFLLPFVPLGEVESTLSFVRSRTTGAFTWKAMAVREYTYDVEEILQAHITARKSSSAKFTSQETEATMNKSKRGYALPGNSNNPHRILRSPTSSARKPPRARGARDWARESVGDIFFGPTHTESTRTEPTHSGLARAEFAHAEQAHFGTKRALKSAIAIEGMWKTLLGKAEAGVLQPKRRRSSEQGQMDRDVFDARAWLWVNLHDIQDARHIGCIPRTRLAFHNAITVMALGGFHPNEVLNMACDQVRLELVQDPQNRSRIALAAHVVIQHSKQLEKALKRSQHKK